MGVKGHRPISPSTASSPNRTAFAGRLWRLAAKPRPGPGRLRNIPLAQGDRGGWSGAPPHLLEVPPLAPGSLCHPRRRAQKFSRLMVLDAGNREVVKLSKVPSDSWGGDLRDLAVPKR